MGIAGIEEQLGSIIAIHERNTDDSEEDLLNGDTGAKIPATDRMEQQLLCPSRLAMQTPIALANKAPERFRLVDEVLKEVRFDHICKKAGLDFDEESFQVE